MIYVAQSFLLNLFMLQCWIRTRRPFSVVAKTRGRHTNREVERNREKQTRIEIVTMTTQRPNHLLHFPMKHAKSVPTCCARVGWHKARQECCCVKMHTPPLPISTFVSPALSPLLLKTIHSKGKSVISATIAVDIKSKIEATTSIDDSTPIDAKMRARRRSTQERNNNRQDIIL